MNTIMEGNNDNVLEIKGLNLFNLSKNSLLLDNIHLNIKRGSFTALVGKSGLGKSVTIKSVLGLLNNNSWRFEGDINFYIRDEANTDLDSSENPAVKKIEILNNGIYNIPNIHNIRGKGIFTVFQSPDTHLNPSLKIGWQIGEMIDLKNPLKNIPLIEKRLTDVGLPADFKEKYPFQLSQGEKQRVLICMALGGADLVIADEPTSSLDVNTKTSIINLLSDLRAQSKIKSLLLITHDLDTIKGLLLPSDTIYVMDYNSSGNVSIAYECIMEDVSNANPDIHRILKPLNIEPSENILSADAVKPVLEIENLVQKHRQGFFKKDIEILKGINLNIFKGEMVGIVGGSGCGKTTLIKSILRLWDNTGGKVLLRSSGSEDAVDLIELQHNGLQPDNLQMQLIRRNLQVIFQNSSSIFNLRMMVYEILYETLQLTGLTDKDKINSIIAEKLVQFNICKKENEILQILTKYPNELSGGEKQRLAILRVFLLEPDIIFADEPFAEQDVLTTHEIIEMFRKINKEGTTIVLISHDLNIIKSLCNKIYLLSDGILTDYTFSESAGCSNEQISKEI
jgi:peptide/nickel transport system ATP-binding protein